MAGYDFNANRRERAGVPNPFRTFSEWIYPKNIKDAFIWGEYLWERNAKYRTCIQKVVSYFLAGLNVQQVKDKEVDAEQLDSFKDCLDDVYGTLQLVQQFGEELAAMGNVFVSAERVFSRELMCPNKDCGWQMRLKNLLKGRDYEWDGENFVGECPQCHRHVTWQVKDVKSELPDGRRIRFVFRPAEDMFVQYNRLTGTFKYLYKMPPDIVDAIKRGDSVYLEDTPKVFMDAAIKGGQLIEFPEDKFFSMRTHTLTCLDKLYKGWGIPLFLVAFNNMIRLQHLDKFNEAVMMDYIIPMRLISPEPQNLKAGIDDPNRMPMSGAQFRTFMSQAFKAVKGNPSQTIVSPVPVSYQRIGGDKDCLPVDIMEYETTELLTDMGIPQEFRQTTFQTVAPSMGLRMFEKQWVHFAKGLDKFTRWLSDLIANAHQFEDMFCTLDTTSFVEDDMNKQVQLNLMQGQMIARTPVLKKYGIDFDDDIKMRVKEQQQENDAMLEQQQDQENTEMVQSVIPPAAAPGIGQAQANIQQMMQQAQGGQPAGPEGPAAPAAPGAPMDPAMAGTPMPFNTNQSQAASVEQLMTDAQQLAQQLYNAPDRQSQLAQLKKTNPQMHAFVTQFLEDMQGQVESEAVVQSKMPQG